MSGKSSPTVIEAPAPPAAPSYQSTMKDYIENYPAYIAMQKQYAPELAQLEYGLQSQYGPQYAELQKQMNEQLYPQTAGLQENLAGQAMQGMNEGLPDDLRQQYVSDFNAGLGMNVNAPIGVSDRNVALTQLNKQWGDYYRNLGLSVAGRQPLAQGQQQQFSDPMAGFQGALNYAQQGYGTQMQGYGQSLANRIVQPGGGGFSGSGAMLGAIGGNMLFPGVGGMIGGAALGGFGN